MAHKKKRRYDGKLAGPSVQHTWPTRTRRLRRIHSAQHVEQTWKHQLVVHPGRTPEQVPIYLAQMSEVPAHRDDIQWLDPAVSATWKRIAPHRGHLNSLVLDGSTLTIASQALQRAGLDTKHLQMQAMKAATMVATDMSMKGKRSIPAWGTAIAQLGLRYRLWEPKSSKRAKIATSAKNPKCADAPWFRVMNTMRHLASVVVETTAAWFSSEVNEREAMLVSVDAFDKGSICSSYPSVQIGVSVGVGIHIDAKDLYWGTWACLGPLTMALPEYGVLLDLEDGDVVTFDTATVWHCMVRTPPEVCKCACLSLYYNREQHAQFLRCVSTECFEPPDRCAKQ